MSLRLSNMTNDNSVLINRFVPIFTCAAIRDFNFLFRYFLSRYNALSCFIEKAAIFLKFFIELNVRMLGEIFLNKIQFN